MVYAAKSAVTTKKEYAMWGKDLSKEQCPTEFILLKTLTKVNELLHGQGRRRKLRKPLHLLRYPKDGTIFQQKLSELHFPLFHEPQLSVNQGQSVLSFFTTLQFDDC